MLLETIGIKQKKFKVTDKKRVQKDRKLLYLMPQVIMLGLSVAALIRFTVGKSGMTLLYGAFIIFWLMFNIITLLYAVFFMLGRNAQRQSERFNARIPLCVSYEGYSIETVTENVSEGGVMFTLPMPVYVPDHTPLTMYLCNERYQATLNAKVLYVDSEKSRWRYHCAVVRMSEANWRQYLQMIYDRPHPLPKKMNSWMTIVDDIINNQYQRMRKSVTERRTEPRVQIDRFVQFEEGGNCTVLDFSYRFLLVRNLTLPSKKPTQLTIRLNEQCRIICTPAKGRPLQPNEKLMKVLNLEEINRNEVFLRALTEWAAHPDLDNTVDMRKRGVGCMTWVVTLARFGALFGSLLGYVAFSRAFLRVPVFFSYIFSLSVIACAMFFAGLAGVLPGTAYVLFGLGFVLLLTVALAGRLPAAFPRPTLSLVNVLYILWFWVAFASLINYRLIHYDNFSHWALVVKQMLLTDAIPDAASSLIDFKNYPLGTSAFLYYVCKIVGRGDGVMLVGQLMLITACFYALNGVIRDRKRFLLAALLGLGASMMSFFNISIRVNNLLVDYLLPLLALAAIAGASESAKKHLVACMASVPVLGLLLITKNTGVFFAIPAFLYLLYAGYPSRAHKRFSIRLVLWISALAAIVLATVPLLLWNAHTRAAFAGVSVKFSLNLSLMQSLDLKNLYALVPDKTPETGAVDHQPSSCTPSHRWIS